MMSRSRFMASATRSRVRSVTLESGDSSSAICCRVTPIRLASAACDKPRSCLAHRSWRRTARIGATVMKVDRPGVRRRGRGRGGADPVARWASSHPSRASRARLTAALRLVPNVWQPGQSGKPTRVRCPSVVRRARYCMVRSGSGSVIDWLSTPVRAQGLHSSGRKRIPDCRSILRSVPIGMSLAGCGTVTSPARYSCRKC